MPKTPDEVQKLARETGIKIVDLKFVDLPGVWQHFSNARQGVTILSS
jgi:glutamine synthetase